VRALRACGPLRFFAVAGLLNRSGPSTNTYEPNLSPSAKQWLIL
jgi:hypothetical protein